MKHVQVEFTGKNMTGNAGLTQLGRFAEKLGVEATLKQTLTIERGANAVYQAADVVLFVLFGVLAGAQHMNHLALLRNDWSCAPFSSGRSFRWRVPWDASFDSLRQNTARNCPRRKPSFGRRSGENGGADA